MNKNSAIAIAHNKKCQNVYKMSWVVTWLGSASLNHIMAYLSLTEWSENAEIVRNRNEMA